MSPSRISHKSPSSLFENRDNYSDPARSCFLRFDLQFPTSNNPRATHMPYLKCISRKHTCTAHAYGNLQKTRHYSIQKIIFSDAPNTQVIPRRFRTTAVYSYSSSLPTQMNISNQYHPETQEAQQTKQIETLKMPSFSAFSSYQTGKLVLHAKSHPIASCCCCCYCCCLAAPPCSAPSPPLPCQPDRTGESVPSYPFSLGRTGTWVPHAE